MGLHFARLVSHGVLLSLHRSASLGHCGVSQAHCPGQSMPPTCQRALRLFSSDRRVCRLLFVCLEWTYVLPPLCALHTGRATLCAKTRQRQGHRPCSGTAPGTLRARRPLLHWGTLLLP